MKKPYTLATLSNGLRIITIPMHENPTATVLVLVEAGSKYETKKNNGISHFLEHMCFKGTEKRAGYGDISLELDTLGAQYNAFTSQEYTGYYAKGKSAQATMLLDIVSDLYIHPTLPEQEIEKEKGVICDEINMYEDMPSRKVFDIFMSLVYGDQPAGLTITGSKEQVRGFTRKDFLRYRSAHYVASATTIVVAGGIDEKAIQQEVKKLFSVVSREDKQAKKKVKDTQKDLAIQLQHKDTDQSHILFGFRAFDTYSKESIVASVLAGVLGGGMSSRFFRKVRDEMGVGYYVGSYNDSFTDHGLLLCNAGVASDRAEEVLEAMLSECKRLQEEPVPESELLKVQELLSSSLSMGLESSDAVAQFYGGQAILRKDIKTREVIEKEIRAVTSLDIMNVAKKMFTLRALNIAIIGPHKDPDLFRVAARKVLGT